VREARKREEIEKPGGIGVQPVRISIMDRSLGSDKGCTERETLTIEKGVRRKSKGTEKGRPDTKG